MKVLNPPHVPTPEREGSGGGGERILDWRRGDIQWDVRERGGEGRGEYWTEDEVIYSGMSEREGGGGREGREYWTGDEVIYRGMSERERGGGTDRWTNIDSDERERGDYARAKGWQRGRNMDEKELVGAGKVCVCVGGGVP